MTSPRALPQVVFSCALIVLASGAPGQSQNEPDPNRTSTPTIWGVSRDSLPLGWVPTPDQPQFTIRIRVNEPARNAVVSFAGPMGTTTVQARVMADGKVHVDVPVHLLAVPGTLRITVTNPDAPSHRGTSNSWELHVRVPTDERVSYNFTEHSVGNNPRALAISDLNEDGRPDYAVAATNGVNVSFQRPDGSYPSMPSFTIPTPEPVTNVLVRDVNGDGDADIVATQGHDSRISVLVQTGSPTNFVNAGDIVTPGPVPCQPAVLFDINLNGILDMVVAHENDHSLGVYIGNGDGTYQDPVTQPALNFPVSLKVLDFNNDGLTDVSYVSAGGAPPFGGLIGVHLNDGNGGLGPVQALPGTPGIGDQLLAGLFDDDDLTDFVQPRFIDFFANSPGLRFTFGNQIGGPPHLAPFVATDVLFTTSGDVDGDGDRDLIVANSPDASKIVRNDGSSQFFAYDAGGFRGGVFAAAADVNGDGQPDVVTVDNVFNPETEELEGRVFVNLANGTAPSLPTIVISDARTTEGNPQGTAFGLSFTLTLSEPQPNPVTVRYRTLDQTAFGSPNPTVGFHDYTEESGTLTFPPNTQSILLDIGQVVDFFDEPDETFLVKLSDPSGASISDDTGLGTIVNDDGPVNVAIQNNVVPEGNGTGNTGFLPILFQDPLTGSQTGSGKLVTIHYDVVGGTAQSNDFQIVTPSPIVVPIGQVGTAIMFQTVADTISEPNETIEVQITTIENGTLLGSGLATLTLTNDDPSSSPAAQLQLQLTPGQGALRVGETFSFNVALENEAGAGAATDANVRLSLPPDLDAANAQATDNTFPRLVKSGPGTLVLEGGTLPAGQSLSADIETPVTQLTPRSGIIRDGSAIVMTVNPTLSEGLSDPLRLWRTLNVDGDTDPDLVGLDRGAGTARVIFDANSSSALQTASFDLLPGNGLYVDLDGFPNASGLDDLAIAQAPVPGASSGGFVHVFRNNGGSFGAPFQTIPLNGVPVNLTSGDANGDLLPDLIATTSGDMGAGSIEVALGSEEGPFGNFTFFPTDAFGPVGTWVFDFDGNGSFDVGVAHQGASPHTHQGVVRLLLNDGQGNLTLEDDSVLLPGSVFAVSGGVSNSPFEPSSTPAAWISDPGNGRILRVPLPPDGTGGIEPGEPIAFFDALAESVGGAPRLAEADVTGDGNAELLASNGAGAVEIYDQISRQITRRIIGTTGPDALVTIPRAMQPGENVLVGGFGGANAVIGIATSSTPGTDAVSAVAPFNVLPVAPVLQTQQVTGPTGTFVSISGGNLRDAKVTFTGTSFRIPASTYLTGLGTLLVIVPPGAITGPVEVENPGGTATLQFVLDEPAADTDPPVFTGTPANIVVSIAPGSTSASVTFPTPTATDASPFTVECTPASGGTFALGTTTVNCVATDAHGNTSTTAFTVTVNAPNAVVENGVATFTATPGQGNGLTVTQTGNRLTIRDDNHPIQPGNGFAHGTDTHEVVCELTGVTGITIQTGDGFDRIVMRGDFTLPTHVEGGADADSYGVDLSVSGAVTISDSGENLDVLTITGTIGDDLVQVASGRISWLLGRIDREGIRNTTLETIGGDDSITIVDGLTAAPSSFLFVEGGNGNDLVMVEDPSNGGNAGEVGFNGGSGLDRLLVRHTGTGGGNHEIRAGRIGRRVTHSDVESAGLQAGGADDAISVTPSPETALDVNCGGGNDRVVVDPQGADVTSGPNPVHVSGAQPVTHEACESDNLPRPEVSVEKVDFGTGEIGTAKTITINIANGAGRLDLLVNSATIDADGAANGFSIPVPPGPRIPAAATSFFDLAWSVLRPGRATGMLILDTNGGPLQVPLEGVPEDKTPPVIHDANDISVPNDPGIDTATVNYQIPRATDNVAVFSMSCSPGPGVVLKIGSHVITCRAVDTSGNATVASFNVNVVDVEDPTITCPPGVTIPAGALATGPVPDFTGLAIAQDNAGPPRVTQAPVAGAAAPVGLNPVVVTAQDAAGNTASCGTSVTVVVGSPRIASRIVGQGVTSPGSGVHFFDLELKNTGTGYARTVRINSLVPRVLGGTGVVSLNPLTGTLPIAVGDLDVGATRAVRVYVNVPSTVTRISLTAVGFLNTVGTGSPLSFAVLSTAFITTR